MFNAVKQFVEQNIQLIDDANLYKLFMLAEKAIPETHNMAELADMLETIGLNTEYIRWSIFDQSVQNYIKYYLTLTPPIDKSNSWARVDYMLEEISDMGFGWQAAKEHVINNGNTYSTTVKPLDPEYGWQGSGDYAFKWFDKIAFEKEYW